MKVFDLVCDAGHRFEGWFASAEAFASQAEACHVRCPLCDSAGVVRAPSAPHINFGAAPSSPAAPAPDTAVMNTSGPKARALFEQLKKLVAATDDVGPRFAEEARRIHYDEVPPRAIRGTATDDERRALDEEGIDTIRLPIPRALTETAQ